MAARALVEMSDSIELLVEEAGQVSAGRRGFRDPSGGKRDGGTRASVRLVSPVDSRTSIPPFVLDALPPAVDTFHSTPALTDASPRLAPLWVQMERLLRLEVRLNRAMEKIRELKTRAMRNRHDLLLVCLEHHESRAKALSGQLQRASHALRREAVEAIELEEAPALRRV